MNQTSALAEFLANADRDIPEAAYAAAEALAADWMSVALAGSRTESGRMTRAVAASWGSSDEAALCGGGRASAAAAALGNGAAAHVLELDDLHPGSTLHPGAPVMAAALAAAERARSSGREYLRAVVLGYEAAIRIGESVNPGHYRYWHPTGTVGTFGAAAAAGTVLGLDAKAMRDALGTAGTQAAGLWEFNAEGAMSKPLHAGKAACNGILAADLARMGFSGAEHILEGERGFLRATAEGGTPERITAGLGQHWKIGETCIKLHACCGHTHTAIDAVLSLRRRGVEMQSLEIETYAQGYAIVHNHAPTDQRQAQFSLGYVTAAAWQDGAVGLAQFAPERIRALAPLLPRMQIRVADDLTARYPSAWPARVRMRLANGTELRAECDFPAGSPQNPASAAALRAKRVALLGEEGAEQVLAWALGLRDAKNMQHTLQEFMKAYRHGH